MSWPTQPCRSGHAGSTELPRWVSPTQRSPSPCAPHSSPVPGYRLSCYWCPASRSLAGSGALRRRFAGHGNIPRRDHWLVVLGAQHADRPSIKPVVPARLWCLAEPPSGENTQHVAVADQRDIAVAEQWPHAAQHGVGTRADVGNTLSGMAAIAGDDAVTPQVPAWPLLPDLVAGEPLITAVIPFPQIRIDLNVSQAGQFGC